MSTVDVQCVVSEVPRDQGLRETLRALRRSRDETDGLTAFRVAPVLLVSDGEGFQRVAIGSTAILVRPGRLVQLQLSLAQVWRRDSSSELFAPVDDAETREQDRADVAQRLEQLATSSSNSLDGLAGQELATQCAKALSERSRNAVQQLRDFRYVVEENLAASSTTSESSFEHARAISSLIQLNVMCGRAGDQAREAVRESLHLHLDDSEAYHSYRKARDPLILNAYAPATHETRPWMRSHDAAVRQCEELQRQLQTESDAIRSLVLAGVSISSARDAEQQAKSNVLAGALSVGLGIPALVLTLYGVSALLPLSAAGHLLAFLPVALAPLAAACYAAYHNDRLKRRLIQCSEAVILAGCVVLLVIAALIAPH